MIFPAGIDIVKKWLEREGTVDNGRILDLLNGNLELQEVVITSLIKQNYAIGSGTSLIRIADGSNNTDNVVYDIFISYCSIDNRSGRIDDMVNELAKLFLKHTGEVINIFFDRAAIKVGDEWRKHINSAIRQSKVFIAVLSPNYLKSKECQNEWKTFTKHQYNWHRDHDHLIGSPDGLIPPYIIDMPKLFNFRVEDLGDWEREIRNKHLLNFCEWYAEKNHSMDKLDTQLKFQELEERCYLKLKDIERRHSIKNTIPPFFKEHVLRKSYIEKIYDILHGYQYPVLALWGLPGVGKSTVAFSYAKKYQLEYQGGCWYIPAASIANTKSKLIELAKTEWQVHFFDNEKEDEYLAWLKVKSYLAELYSKKTINTPY